ncbi:helicase associated domain-containing protein [Pseudarthrobacter sp. S9]|uniref:helicase associated domain-containing protein n=1 Tax=Pseudarthrobacter sp. S9 TaxID=3418421 RepID=UPI003D086192
MSHERLAQLVEFRHEGNDWPRHHDYASDEEHTLGVWIHTQRYKHRRGDLGMARIKLLDAAVPGWQTGRTRAAHPAGDRIRVVPIGGRWSPPHSSKLSPLACNPSHRRSARSGDRGLS